MWGSVKIESIPQPVIANVCRLATAGGCQLVAACDLAVASEEATFSVPGMKLGLCCTTPMVPLTRAIGRKRALEMLLTAETVSAQTAADWGLVNRVVPDDDLDATARDLALAICNASPLTVELGKQTFYVQADLDDPKAYAYAKELMTMNAMAADAHEGIRAFLEKRRPIWTGR
jgi:enoyl-CoA hydratase/carnithine racemase